MWEWMKFINEAKVMNKGLNNNSEHGNGWMPWSHYSEWVSFLWIVIWHWINILKSLEYNGNERGCDKEWMLLSHLCHINEWDCKNIWISWMSMSIMIIIMNDCCDNECVVYEWCGHEWMLCKSILQEWCANKWLLCMTAVIMN